MRMGYGDIKNQFLRNINFSGSSDAGILADFTSNLQQRYQLILSYLGNYQTQKTVTQATVAGTQYYDYPLSLSNIEDVVVTVGSVNYPLEIVNSQHNWNLLNAIQVQASAIPQFIFPRSPYLSVADGGGYGIWPVPQDANTITFNFHYRDRGLAIDDYTTGTVTMTAASGTVTGLGTTFTADMVGRSFQLTSTTNPGWGYWYLVTGFTSATVITIAPVWQGTSGGTLNYRISQVPLLPEEAHILLPDGATADFYAGVRKDMVSAVWWNNKFWTGDGQNATRELGTGKIASGLIGIVDRFNDRNNQHIINRRPRINPLEYKVWATRLS